MCGIAGIVRLHGLPPDEPLERMTEALRHRGPDDVGYYRDDQAWLGHRRLSIIDLSDSGRQPLANEDGSLQLVFNGEIYDYPVIRRDLERAGHRFRSATDGEVLLHLYEQHGLGLTSRIDGMFAFAIWDRPRRRLLLARDPMGKKPLYLARLGGDGLLFASELKALLEHPAVSRRLSPEALHAYLLLGYVPSPLSILKAVTKLSPGHTAMFSEAGLETTAYFQPTLDPLERPRTPAEIEDEALALLRRAVRRRLVADVEVGIFLSGGIDSSLVTALTVEAMPKVKTFTIGFAESAFDESPYARRVAETLGTEHITEMCSPESLVTGLGDVLATFDEPFADASALPTCMLARMTARHLKVALGGDGADELFGGYPTLRAQRWADVLGRVPFAPALMAAAADSLREGDGYYPFAYVLRRFAAGCALEPWERQLTWTAYVMPGDLPALRPGAHGWPPTVTALAEACRAPLSEAVSHTLDQRLYLPDDILVKTDRASMGHALEVRAPFLDHRLVAFANRLPPEWTRNKILLRNLLRKTTIPFVAERRKKGFAVPVARWLRRDLKHWAMERLRTPARVGLDSRAVKNLWAEHVLDRRDRWRELWAILVLLEWAQRWHAEL